MVPQWLDLFTVVAHTEVHDDHQHLKQICSFLGLFHLFMHKVSKSEAQVTGCSLQLFYSWKSEEYHNIILMLCYREIVTLRVAQRKKITLKIFLEGCRSS
jgi:hypothetical protein